MPARRSIIAASIVAALLIASGVFAFTRLRHPQSASRRSPAERLALLDNSLHAFEDAERDAPRDRWDPEYVVAHLGKNPQMLFDWVKNNTTWIPYRGELRGPVGVLMDRQGNSLDRALLLATLLEKAGHHARLAHVQLPRSEAVGLLSILQIDHAARGETPVTERTQPAQVAVVAHQYRIDPATVSENVSTHDKIADNLFAEFRSRVSDQAARLRTQVAAPSLAEDWKQRLEESIEAVADHWWVQREDAGIWVDLDVADPEHLAADRTLELNAIPPDLQHQLVVRLIEEEWSAGNFKEVTVLEHTLQPANLIGQPIVLQLLPARWPKEVAPDPNSPLGLKGIALEQKQWTASLVVGGASVAQGTLSVNGERAASAGGGALGGLGAGIAAALAPESSASNGRELSAAWVEYEIRAPGRRPRTIRRAIFDLFGPAARADHQTSALEMDERKKLTRSLALMMRTEIVPQTSAMAPEFVRHLTVQSLLSNKNALRAVTTAMSDSSTSDPDSVLGSAAQSISPLYSLALARLQMSRYRDEMFVDQINLLTRHRHAGVLGDGYAIRGAVDIVARDLGVSLSLKNAFAARQEQGVVDSNAEALWWTGEGINNTAEAYKLSHDWETFTRDGAGDVDQSALPPDSRARIKQDLSDGFIVIAPKHPIEVGPDRFVGWWRIDPVTGTTQSTAGNGWGQCGAESSVHWQVASRAINTMAYEYILCHSIAQVGNGMRAWGEFLQARLWWLKKIAPPAAKSADPADVARAVNKGCLMGALMAGVLVTLPLVMIQAERWAQFGLITEREQSVMNAARKRAGTLEPVKSPEAYGGLARTQTLPKPDVPPREPPSPRPPEPQPPPRPASPAPAPDPRYRGDPRPTPSLAPKGEGPFQGDPEIQQWRRDNWSRDPNETHRAAEKMGDPAIYDAADAAAVNRYNSARARGLGDQAARQESFQEWMKYVRDRGPSFYGGGTEGIGPPRGSPPPGSGGSNAKFAVGAGGLAESINPPWPNQ
ncbi:MAG TPA: hypothetical protein VM166_06290 [Gemmatimonadaceae bacterium]|nr:hypothetical protein [Gemmatimonadaceae bacterium]